MEYKNRTRIPYVHLTVSSISEFFDLWAKDVYDVLEL